MPTSGQSAQASEPAAAPASASAGATDAVATGQLSLQEMSRIMDVAATLRKERALVDAQLNIHEIKAALRQRLLEAAKISGDPVTAAEIDAAVNQYYSQLHEFRDPPASFTKLLAHAWVLRGPLVKAALAVLAAIGALWGALAAGMLPGEARDARLARSAAVEAAERQQSLEQLAQSVAELSADPEVAREAQALAAAGRAALQTNDAEALNAATAQLSDLLAVLNQEFTLSIASRPGEPTGMDRYWTDEQGTRASGYYVFVVARDAKGQPVEVPIENRETGRIERVSRWAEQVPASVYERLKADKQADGVLDERAFGVKRRGERDLTVTLPGDDGAPAPRQGQLTSW